MKEIGHIVGLTVLITVLGCTAVHITDREETCLENLRTANNLLFFVALNEMGGGTNTIQGILLQFTGSTNMPACPSGGKFINLDTRPRCSIHGDLLKKYGTGAEGFGFDDPAKENRKLIGIGLPNKPRERMSP